MPPQQEDATTRRGGGGGGGAAAGGSAASAVRLSRPRIRLTLADVATYPVMLAVVLGGCLVLALAVRKAAQALDSRNVDLTVQADEPGHRPDAQCTTAPAPRTQRTELNLPCSPPSSAAVLHCLRVRPLAELQQASGVREVKAAAPVRRAAEALFYNPHHAPPPAPPPPHSPGVETEEAQDGALMPMPTPQRSVLLLPVLPPVCWVRDVLATIFPALFCSGRDVRPVEAELEAEMQNARAAGRRTTEAGDAAAALPACCRSSYRALLMSLLMPFLAVRPRQSQAETTLQQPPPALRVAAAERQHPPLLIAAPEEHPEVLFDCAADCDAVGEDQLDDEDRSDVYFVHIYERYLAMAEDLSW